MAYTYIKLQKEFNITQFPNRWTLPILLIEKYLKQKNESSNLIIEFNIDQTFRNFIEMEFLCKPLSDN